MHLNKEEIANSISHLIGLLLSVIGTGYLIYLGSRLSFLKTLSISIFGASLIILYLFSTCYHFSKYDTKAKFILQKLDHAAIYFLIAGTYTPIMVLSIGGNLSIEILTIIWFLAILGIFLEISGLVRKKFFFLTLYVVMGWLAVLFIKSIFLGMSIQAIIMLIIGGLFYTTGVYFYVKKSMVFNHAIWHIFVLFGSVSHYICILLIL